MTADVLTLATFASAWAVLDAGHGLADHVFGQSDEQAAHKADPGEKGWRALAGHIVGYHTVIVVLLGAAWLFLPVQMSLLGLVAGLVWSAGTHALLDRRWPVRWVLQRTGSAEFAERTSPICGMYLADQALHRGCLLVSAGLIALL